MAQEMAKQKEIPTQETAILEIRGYYEVAKIKHAINESLDSIKESIKSLQIIDEMPKINFYEKLFELGKDLKKLKGLEYPSRTGKNLKIILEEKNILSSDMEDLKEKVDKRIDVIRLEEDF